LAGAMTKILHDPQAQSTAYETAKQLRACLVGEAGQFDRLVIDALATWLGPVPAKIS
jgi:hypothetical protein